MSKTGKDVWIVTVLAIILLFLASYELSNPILITVSFWVILVWSICLIRTAICLEFLVNSKKRFLPPENTEPTLKRD